MSFKFLFLVLISEFINASNIDTSYPVIIKNTADGPNSFFGSTVALINDQPNPPGIIIGSPRSNSTLESHENIVEPGVLWQCSFKPGANACRVLVMDPTGNTLDPNRAKVTDRKDGGWLGGAMTQSSENFVSCGSRWINQNTEMDKNRYLMNGICYWRSKNDIFMDQLPPPQNGSRLLPLVNESKGHWTFGQAGFSAHIPSKNRNEMILGAPGVSAWKGSVIRLSNSRGGSPFGDSLVYQPELIPENFYKNDSYFGFAVTSGNFFTYDNKTSVQYVASAPRGNNLTGEVTIFRFPGTSEEKLENLYKIFGRQVGSYFGASLCVADVNGDGYDDLLVGAPQFSVEFKKNPKFPEKGSKRAFITRGSENGDEGAVFIYLNFEGKDLIAQKTPGYVNGRAIPWSQFGAAIANLGDINDDGFHDIAIGAPYEKGQGSVYIYFGSENGITQHGLRQQIYASDFKGINLKGFGYSFSQAVDIDSNGYNDFAIGAYDSGHVVLLRTRPLVTIIGHVSSTITRLPFDTKSFGIKSCVMYTGEHAPDKLSLQITVISDAQSSAIKRVVVQLPGQDGSAEHVYTDHLSKGVEKCTEFTIAVVKALETSGNPVVMRQYIEIPEFIEETYPTIYDITRFGGLVTTRISGDGYGKFCKNCPVKDLTRSTLKDLNLPLAVFCGADDKCVADLLMEASFLELQNLPLHAPFLLGSIPTLTLEVKVLNYEETAIAPTLTVSWKTVGLRKIPPECQKTPFSNETFTQYKCELGKILEAGKSRTVQLEFNMEELMAGDAEELWLHLQLSTASDVVDYSKLSKTISLPLQAQADIFIEGSSNSVKINPETKLPIIRLPHSYEVELDGPSPISGASLEFEIPVSFEHSGEKVLVQIPQPETMISNDLSLIKCVAKNNDFYKNPFARSRAERTTTQTPLVDDSDSEVQSFMTTLAPDIKLGGFGRSAKKVLNIDCSEPSVQCMIVECTIGKLRPGTSITIMFNLGIESSYLRTFFKKTKFGSIKLISGGKANILGTERDIQPSPNKDDEAKSVFLIELESAKPVANWMWGVGIIIGFLILSVIGFGLYKCGCFNRNKSAIPEDEVDSPEAMPLKETANNADEDEDDDTKSRNRNTEESEN